MAAVGDVPDVIGREMAVGAGHCFISLKRAFYFRKGAAKRLGCSYSTVLYCRINALRGSNLVPETNGGGLSFLRRFDFDASSSTPQLYAFIKSMPRIVAGVFPLLAVSSMVPTLHVHR